MRRCVEAPRGVCHGAAYVYLDAEHGGLTYAAARHPPDGVIETANGGEEEFGQERLDRLLTASAGRTAEEMADLILSTVQDWASTQADDLTVVAFDCY
jgi:serine phosphatase RsbU (regulator of sigma subunit)